MTANIDTNWGPLAEPIHPDAAAPNEPVWKDNSYIAFWDVPNQVIGSFHVSTSPNAPGGRRARCSVNVAGKVVEIIEDLEPGTFTSVSIDYGLDGRIAVRHPKLEADLVNTPLFTSADYSVGGVVPELVPGKPLQHFQQGLEMKGTLRIDGAEITVNGHGMRDRTWGFRDEATMWVEYIGVVGVFGDSFISIMKFLGCNGNLKTDGFIIEEQGARSVSDMGVGRDAAGLFRLARLKDADGGNRLVTMSERLGGFFVPMGADTEGPGFGTYDDFLTLELDGAVGAGFVEQGIVHRVY